MILFQSCLSIFFYLQLMTIGNSQAYACYECAEIIRKFYFIKQKFVRSQAVLYGLIDDTGKVNFHFFLYFNHN